MIQVRLQRRGRKNDPTFRVIVVDSKKKPKTGNYLEMVGSYDPRVDRVELKGERILAWIAQGAQVSDTVHNLLVSQKIITAKKINVLPKKVVAPKEVPAEEPKAVAPVESSLAVESAPAEVAEGMSSEALVKEDNSVAEEPVAA